MVFGPFFFIFFVQKSSRLVEAFDMTSKIYMYKMKCCTNAYLMEKRLREAIVRIHMFGEDIIHGKKKKLRSRWKGDEQDLLSKMIFVFTFLFSPNGVLKNPNS